MLKSRTCGRGGGVGLFFDNNLEIGTKLRDDLACPDTKYKNTKIQKYKNYREFICSDFSD